MSTLRQQTASQRLLCLSGCARQDTAFAWAQRAHHPGQGEELEQPYSVSATLWAHDGRAGSGPESTI
eukprot:1973988-Prymnesium_polylepis.1